MPESITKEAARMTVYRGFRVWPKVFILGLSKSASLKSNGIVKPAMYKVRATVMVNSPEAHSVAPVNIHGSTTVAAPQTTLNSGSLSPGTSLSAFILCTQFLGTIA